MPSEFPRLVCECCNYIISPGSKYLKLDNGAYCVCKSCVDNSSPSEILEMLQVDFDVAG